MTHLQAGHLIYPLRLNAHLLHQQLRRCTVGGQAGRLIVEAIEALHRAERIARELTPHDPSGL